MAKKGIVGKKEQKLRGEYADYLAAMKRGGKASHKKSKTYYEWKKATPATRSTLKRKSKSN